MLPDLSAQNVYLAGLGCLLSAVYVAGLIVRSRYRIARMGIDSLVVLVLVLYALGVLRLLVVPGT